MGVRWGGGSASRFAVPSVWAIARMGGPEGVGFSGVRLGDGCNHRGSPCYVPCRPCGRPLPDSGWLQRRLVLAVGPLPLRQQQDASVGGQVVEEDVEPALLEGEGDADAG